MKKTKKEVVNVEQDVAVRNYMKNTLQKVFDRINGARCSMEVDDYDFGRENGLFTAYSVIAEEFEVFLKDDGVVCSA